MLRPAASRISVEGSASQAAETTLGMIPLRELKLGPQIGEDSLGPVLKAEHQGRKMVARLVSAQPADGAPGDASGQEREQIQRLHNSLQHVTRTFLRPNLLNFLGLCDRRHEGSAVLLCEPYTLTLREAIKQASPEVSALKKAELAQQIAAMLRFLHSTSNRYHHGMLNLDNVLVDAKLSKIKVANYALGNYRTERRRGFDDVYWKAPEVLEYEISASKPSHGSSNSDAASQPSQPQQAPLFIDELNQLSGDHPFNGERADVYSFGILLWEIWSKKKAFADHKSSLAGLIQAVARERKRPPLGEDWPDGIISLIARCWSVSPDARPTFASIGDAFEDVLLELTIDDNLGRQFWKSTFRGRMEVDWMEFQRAFWDYLKVPASTAQDPRPICLHEVMKELDEDDTPDGRVTAKMFSATMEWFGPLEGPAILDRITEQLSKKWFHGKLSGKEAEERVMKEERGSFLFRFSTSEAGCYAITVHSKRGVPKHFRIYHRPGGGYLIGKSECSSLYQIIVLFGKDLYLKEPCNGSRFQAIFDPASSLAQKRYEMWDDEGL